MRVVLQELMRMQVMKSDLDCEIAPIKTHVPLAPTELIFNTDESGFSDWEERRPKRE
jgi:hypothetical protein